MATSDCHGCMGAWVHGCMGAWVHGCMHACTPHPCMHARMHTCIYIHACLYTCKQLSRSASIPQMGAATRGKSSTTTIGKRARRGGSEAAGQKQLVRSARMMRTPDGMRLCTALPRGPSRRYTHTHTHAAGGLQPSRRRATRIGAS